MIHNYLTTVNGQKVNKTFQLQVVYLNDIVHSIRLLVPH